MDVDIRKPDNGALHIARPSGSRESGESAGGTGQTSGSSPDLLSPEGEYTYEEPQSEGEDDDPMTQVADTRAEGKLVRVSAAELAEASSYRERYLLEAMAERQAQANEGLSGSLGANGSAGTASSTTNRPRNLSIDPLATAQAFDQSFRRKLSKRRPSVVFEDDSANGGEAEDGRDAAERQLEAQLGVISSAQEEQVQLLRQWTAPAGKKVAVPVRIEPKVYFASERTFLVRLLPLFLANFCH